MYAIVETSGKQYRVEPGCSVVVDRMKVEVGETITLDRILLVGGDGLKVGSPTVEGAVVKAKVTSHTKGKKVITRKYTRRQRTRRRVGFRADLTTLEIVSIDA